MARWQVVMSIVQNNRQLSMAQNATDTAATDFSLLDDQDNVLATLVLTETEVQAMAIMIAQAKSNKQLSDIGE